MYCTYLVTEEDGAIFLAESDLYPLAGLISIEQLRNQALIQMRWMGLTENFDFARIKIVKGELSEIVELQILSSQNPTPLKFKSR